MSDSASSSLPLSSKDDNVPSGGQREVRWEVVARAPGLAPATIIAGRLHAEGIPARAWQEGAGQALGLTVGLLGTGYVEVPQEYAPKAREILAAAEEGTFDEWDEDEWDDDEWDEDEWDDEWDEE